MQSAVSAWIVSCVRGSACTAIGGVMGCCPVGATCDRILQCMDFGADECAVADSAPECWSVSPCTGTYLPGGADGSQSEGRAVLRSDAEHLRRAPCLLPPPIEASADPDPAPHHPRRPPSWCANHHPVRDLPDRGPSGNLAGAGRHLPNAHVRSRQRRAGDSRRSAVAVVVAVVVVAVVVVAIAVAVRECGGPRRRHQSGRWEPYEVRERQRRQGRRKERVHAAARGIGSRGGGVLVALSRRTWIWVGGGVWRFASMILLVCRDGWGVRTEHIRQCG